MSGKFNDGKQRAKARAELEAEGFVPKSGKELEMQAALANFKTGLSDDDMDYEAMSEVLACELEAAIAALTRRGITPDFDTDGLAEYRTAHPRQDA